jgi:Zn-finger nucleic acid-binding protein
MNHNTIVGVPMANILCPACATEMQIQRDPDLAYEHCPTCQSIFLDKDELNSLATARAGNIEYCSSTNKGADDTFTARECPKCTSSTMHKVNLLWGSELILDYCEQCSGFFMDTNEVAKMNQELAEIVASASGDEFRNYIGDYFVRVDIKEYLSVTVRVEVAGSALQPGAPQQYLEISVFFKSPLNVNLRITPETMFMKLRKHLPIFKIEEFEVGDRNFDDAFLVQGESKEKVLTLLNAELRQKLQDFHNRSFQLVGKPSNIEMHDDRIVFTEGPFFDDSRYDAQKDEKGVIAAMIELAQAVDAQATSL